jgi:predicted ATPase/class 3 adenylate cyclase
LRRFLAELSRRRLLGAVSAYAIVAWLLVQGASIVLPAFDAPPWVLRAVIVLAIVGAPVTVLTAWLFDLTPRGFVRTADLPEPPIDEDAGEPAAAEQGAPATGPADGRTLDAGPERRQVTLLYAGLAVRDPRSGEIDPEVERETLPVVRAACEQAVEPWGGTRGTAAGNDFALYFGVPTAHEDDALRAIRAGLAMQRAVEQLNGSWRERDVACELRVTIHTGTVIAEDTAGNGHAGPARLSGDAVKVPGAMQFHAQPGEVVITSATYRLVEDMIDGEERGSAALGARSESLYRVTHVAEGRSRGSTLAGAVLVGRDQEQALLEERWSLARRGTAGDGEGQAVLVSGEPGIGKSRIVQRVIEVASRDEQSRVLLGQCSPYHQQRSLYPVAGLLQRDVIGLDPDRDDAARAAQLEQFLAAAGLEPAQSMPLFGALLAVPHGYPPLQLAPERQLQLLLEQVVSILIERAESAPTLVVIEDLHWADAATLDFLSLLIDQLPTSRMLLLVTFRPEFEPPWTLRSNMLRLPMSRLSQKAAEQIVARIAQPREVPPRVVQRIVERADGVPLFVEELTKSVLESGMLDRAADGDELPVTIPGTLQESLAARLDRLGPTKRLAQIAATIGREFPHALLAAVADLDEASLDRLLDQLIDGEFILRKGIGRKARYIFKHALIQDAAYESLLKSKRREYHGRIAAALEQQFPELCASQPELLALHFGEAAQYEPAVRYGLAAGQHAARRSANTEAVYYLERCLGALHEVPPGHARDLTELSVQMSLMPALVATRGYGAADLERTCSRALALCDAVGDVPEKVFALFGLWMFHVVRANHAQSLELAQRFAELARVSGNDDLQVEADLIMGLAHFFVAQLDVAVAHLLACVERYDRERHGDHAYRFGQDPRVIACSYLSWLHWLRGDDAASQAASDLAVSSAEELNHPLTLSFGYTFAAWLGIYRDDFVTARHYADEIVPLCAEYGILVFLAHGKVALAWLDCVERNEPSRRQVLQRNIDDFLALGARCFVPLWESHVAEVHLDGGDLAACVAMLERSADDVAATGELWADPDLHRVRARMMLARGDVPEAIAAEFDHGEVQARAMGARAWEARIVRSRSQTT